MGRLIASLFVAVLMLLLLAVAGCHRSPASRAMDYAEWGLTATTHDPRLTEAGEHFDAAMRLARQAQGLDNNGNVPTLGR